MTYDFKHYDQWRNSLTCNTCGDQHYRKGLCRHHYKQEAKKLFHCTHKNCLSPVFSHTLCLRHYRSFTQKCLICSRHVYYKHLCRKCYRECTKTGFWPEIPLCTHYGCNCKVFSQQLCLKHFKQKYTTCSECDENTFRKGLCCKHYWRKRREEERKNEKK